MTTLGFIGAGNMGSALLKGFSTSEAAKDVKLHVYDSDPLRRDMMKAAKFLVSEDEAEIAENCKYIVLACKPQQLSELLYKIKAALTSETVLISLCAGITVDYIRQRTESRTKIALVMPNMPMLLGAGTSAIAYDEALSLSESKFVRELVESCGTAEVIPADKMNEIICLNASSPAFIYYFAKCFVDYAISQDINPKAALNLFSGTLIGSAKMLMESSGGIGDLITQVSSPGGTTVAGLDELYAAGFDEIVKSACEACTNRAYELGNQE
jgi:pyrroline-5-carboxylate reductase